MIIELKYTFVFKENNGVFEGFFPDFQTLGTFKASNQDDLFKIAKVAERQYCKKNLKHLPLVTKYFDIFKKYISELNYQATTFLEYIDEFHNGENSLVSDVCKEFKELLTNKDYEFIEDYIARYYKQTACDVAEFNCLVLEYYALHKKDDEKASDAFEYYHNGDFHHQVMPSIEVMDYLMKIGYSVDVATMLMFLKDEISNNKYSRYFGNNALLKEVETRLEPLKEEFPNLFK